MERWSLHSNYSFRIRKVAINYPVGDGYVPIGKYYPSETRFGVHPVVDLGDSDQFLSRAARPPVKHQPTQSLMPFKLLFLVVAVAIIVAGCLGWRWFSRVKSTSIVPDKLNYPCLRIIDGSDWERIDSSRDLNVMPSNRFMNRKDDPLVIDSEFRVFEMSQLKMKESTLGLMITGPKPIQVEFELIARSDKSIDNAKEMITKVLSQEPSFSDEWRQAIPAARSLEAFLELLELPKLLAGPH